MLHYFGKDIYEMEGAEAMQLIARVNDVCSYVKVPNPENKDETIMKPRSAIFRWCEQWNEDHPQLVDDSTLIDGATLAELGGDYVEV